MRHCKRKHLSHGPHAKRALEELLLLLAQEPTPDLRDSPPEGWACARGWRGRRLWGAGATKRIEVCRGILEGSKARKGWLCLSD